jgi:hypothetical protein
VSVRWSVEEGPEGARFVVTGLRLWPIAVFMSFWLCGWTAGEVSVLHQLFRGETPGFASVFLLFWLAGWTVGGVFAWAICLYSLFGREVILVGAGRFRLRWQALAFYWTREFSPDEIRGMRVVVAGPKEAQEGRPTRFISLAAVAFRHAKGRMAFGLGLPPDDARTLFEAVRSRAGLPATAFEDPSPDPFDAPGT